MMRMLVLAINRAALFIAVFVVGTLSPVTTAGAHTSSTAYLQIAPAEDGSATLMWRIALRDLDALLDLDADGDGRLTWGEVDDRGADIRALAARTLRLRTAGDGDTAPRCALDWQGPRFVRTADAGFAELTATSTTAGGACGPQAGVLYLDYRLFERIDPSHRVLIQTPASAQPLLAAAGRLPPLKLATDASAMSPAAQTSDKDAARFGAMYVEGVGHILSGFDHMLFLVALMLPAVLVRTAGRWQPNPDGRHALLAVVGLATAFTIAHSITLGLASFHVVRVRATVIEPLIALTVLLAALNNLRPIVTRGLAFAAFAFGLVHGFGFAEVLAPLELPTRELAVALLAFNLGVETGQLIVIATAFSALAALRRWAGYPRWILGAGSAVLAIVACAWMIERTVGTALL